MSRFLKILIVGVAGLVFCTAAQSQDRRAIWSFHQSPAGEGINTVSTLSFGIPETDAIAFVASCGGGEQGPSIPVMLMVDFGNLSNGTPVTAHFKSRNLDAHYAGTVIVQSSEYAGVQLQVGIDDQLWQILIGNRRISFGVTDLSKTKISLRRSSGPVRSFVAACRAQFAALDARAPPAASDLVTHNYVCEDGSRFGVRFDNSRSFSIASVSLAGRPEIQLIEAVSGSGARYSNGDYELHTKAGTALLSHGNLLLRCHTN